VFEIERDFTENPEVVVFFDPKDETVTKPPGAIPARSWKISDEILK
jgi:hypothetical protein